MWSRPNRFIGTVYYRGCKLGIVSSVTKIDAWAFYNCRSLESVVIGNNVTYIGNDAFNGCSSLTSVVIPDSVTIICPAAFYGCSSLTSIKYRGTQEQWNGIKKYSDWDDKTGDYTITYNYDDE